MAHPMGISFSRALLAQLALCALAATACGGDDAKANSGVTSGTSGSGASPTGQAGSPAGGAAGQAAAGTAAPAAGSGGTGGTAGNGAPGAGGGGSSAANAGIGAVAGSGSMMPAAGSGAPGVVRPTMCNGKPLPPRALGTGTYPYAVGPETAGLAPYWPTDGWKTETPDKLGFDPAKLMTAIDFDTQYASTQAVFVVRHGYVAAEKYVGSFRATSTHESFSMAKSFTSGLIGIAIAEGKIKSTDDKICAAYPMQWDCNDSADKRSRITIDHSMNLMSGLDWHEDWRTTASGVNDAYNLNMLDTILAREGVNEPGTVKRYSTADPSLLSGVLQTATGMTAYQYAKTKIFDVIGIPNVRWNTDNRGRTTTYAGLQATASDYAKYGYLYLNRGKWADKQVVPAEWVDRTTQTDKPCEIWNQYLWHVNLPYRLGKQDPACGMTDASFCDPTDIANLPPEAFSALGINGQLILVVPSADLVVVRFGNDMPGIERWDEYARGLLEGILDAIK